MIAYLPPFHNAHKIQIVRGDDENGSAFWLVWDPEYREWNETDSFQTALLYTRNILKARILKEKK